jgi:hypothetical protein
MWEAITTAITTIAGVIIFILKRKNDKCKKEKEISENKRYFTDGY